MPLGTYTARAISMLSDREAECTLKVKGPSLIDRIKDWIGVKLGKIVKKNAMSRQSQLTLTTLSEA